MTRLDLDQLSVGRDSFRLGPLDLQARGGEVIAVICPNGAGKTTLLAPADLDAARSALDRLGVGALADRPFDHLSSGQQQLVLIARLMVQEAAVCLLDEPLAMLDPAHATAVERAVHDLAGVGRLIIASTHGLSFAARADRVIAIGPDGAVVLPPGEALSPARMADLFGVAVAVCPCCGQPAVA